MAKVLVHDNRVEIRVSLLERLMLAERARKLPLTRIRKVTPHPPLLDLMLHWEGHGGRYMGDVGAYEGHMIPRAINPAHTLAIEVDGEEERVFVEVEDEAPEHVAHRIQQARLAMDRGMQGQPEPEPPATNCAARDQLAALLSQLEADAEQELDEEQEGGWGSELEATRRHRKAGADDEDLRHAALVTPEGRTPSKRWHTPGAAQPSTWWLMMVGLLSAAVGALTLGSAWLGLSLAGMGLACGVAALARPRLLAERGDAS